METRTIKYQETQLFKWIIFPMLILIAFLILSYENQWGDTPIPFLATVLTSLAFLIVILLFYKLTITIDEKSITAAFGIGLIKKTVLLNNLEFSSIEEIKTPWYYGIGLRITPQGILYNTKPGPAIKLKSTIGNKALLIGTNDFNKINKILTELKP